MYDEHLDLSRPIPFESEVERDAAADTLLIRYLFEGVELASATVYRDYAPYAALAGSWSGDVEQPGADAYSATVVFESSADVGEVIAAVEYPELSCGGDLLRSPESGSTLRLVEDISYGLDTCADGVELEADHDPDADTLSVRYYWDGDEVAWATLSRD